MLRLLLSMTLLVSTLLSVGQDLNRRVFLGIGMEELTPELRQTLGYSEAEGIYISQVLPEGSFGVMGLTEGSVLQRINDQPIGAISDVMEILPGITAGDPISTQVFVSGESQEFKGLAQGRPVEEHPGAEVVYGTVNYSGNKLRSLLYLPVGVDNPPVVFFIQGYTCQTIEMYPGNPAKQLLDDMISQGIAVYLVEKPGIGDSKCDQGCMEINFDQEVEAFRQAYRSLQSDPRIDSEQIYLFGHSMGGLIAPILAEEYAPKGVMAFGILGMNWYDYMVKIYTEQELIMGGDSASVAENKKYMLPFLKDYLIEKKAPTELIQHPEYGPYLNETGIAQALSEGTYIARHYSFWQNLSDVDIPGLWGTCKVPVLILHGELDIQVIRPEYAQLIVKQVNQNGGNASYEEFQGTDHAFCKFESQASLLESMNDGSYGRKLSTHYNPAIAQAAVRWMRNMK